MFLEVEFQKILNIFKFLKAFKIPGCTRVLRDNFTTFPESIIPVHAIEIRLSSRLVFPEVETQKISYKFLKNCYRRNKFSHVEIQNIF